MTDHPDNTGPHETEIAGGLNPRDLLAMNLDSRTLPDGEPTPRGPVPTPEELAEKFPQFEILECLGRGGMGVVYKARQRALDRLVAVKILAGERGNDPGFATHFEHEARILAKLNHPNIVTVHDFGEAGGLFYIAMEFVDGVNLRDLMREGKLDPEQALAIVPPICDALQAAHRQGIVHCDIKPENILLDREGRVKIADFGIAKLTGAATAHAAGTPQYMAPEQAGNAAAVDSRADIYSLGVVFYEMLTGERPGKDFQGPSTKARMDARLDGIVRRALEKEPQSRYQTAEEFKTIVQTVARPPELPRAAAPLTAAPKGPFRRWWWVFPVMMVLGVILGTIGGAVWAYVVPRKYEVESVVEVLSVNQHATNPNWIARSHERIKSAATLAQVVARLDLAKKWDTDPQTAMNTLGGMVTSQRLGHTDLISIRLKSSDAVEAVEALNELVKVASEQLPAGRDADDIRIHETASPGNVVASPNVILLLAIGAVGGFVLSPLLALACIPLLQWIFPAHRPRSGIKGKKRIGFAVGAVGVGLLGWALFNHFRDGNMNARTLTSAAAVTRTSPVGSVKFSTPDLTGGTAMTLPLDDRTLEKGKRGNWMPSSGQSITLKDNRRFLFKVRLSREFSGEVMAFVSVSENGERWETKGVGIGTMKPGEPWPEPIQVQFSNGSVITVTQIPRAER